MEPLRDYQEVPVIDFQPNPHPASDFERSEILRNPGFAVHATDNVITATWSDGNWHDFRLEAFSPIRLDPRAMALHYGQSIFEGMKAVAQGDGSVALFRPDLNARRFANSALRLGIPPISVEMFLEACHTLVSHERAWVPDRPGTSLYVRPTLFAVEPCLTVRPAEEYRFELITLPAAPYFSAEFTAISVGVLPEYTRAAPGGTGAIKCAGNYAASYLAKKRTHDELGTDEVLWLDATTHTNLEELSGMNVMCVYEDGSVATPRLEGTILPGVTRDSILHLGRALGKEMHERDITLEELRSGRVVEMFACGTAAVIAPIGRVRQADHEDLVFGDGTPGPVATQLFGELVAIQRGESSHFPEWRHTVRHLPTL